MDNEQFPKLTNGSVMFRRPAASDCPVVQFAVERDGHAGLNDTKKHLVRVLLRMNHLSFARLLSSKSGLNATLGLSCNKREGLVMRNLIEDGRQVDESEDNSSSRSTHRG